MTGVAAQAGEYGTEASKNGRNNDQSRLFVSLNLPYHGGLENKLTQGMD
jgi:hypothetical protein